MSTYKIFFSTTASSVVTVEADDLESAIDLAYDELPRDVCAQCGGWGQGPGIELAGEWEVAPDYYEVDGEFIDTSRRGQA